MKNQDHGASEQDDNDQTNGAGESGFVVPEPDGVTSGRPFGNEAPASRDEHATARSGSARRTSWAMPSSRARRADGAQLRGLSLKRKLTLSLGLLTAVILILGAVSMLTLRDIGVQGVEELRNHAELSRLADAIRHDMAMIHDAEKDFLLLEDASAVDQVKQLTDRLRAHIDEINRASLRFSQSTGMSVVERFAAIGTASNNYEKRFEALAKLIEGNRAALAESSQQEGSAGAQLNASLNAAIDTAEDLMDRYWGRLTAPEGRAANAWSREREQARLLSGFARDLIDARAGLNAFIAGRNPGYPEVTRETLAETLAQLDLMRDQSADPRLKRELGDLRKSLLSYAAQLREAGARIAVAAAQGNELKAQIDDEKAALRAIGADIGKLAEELSADAWRDIGRESERLMRTSTGAQWILGITVLVGALVGLLVLFTVPRPIVTAIDQLMAGSQRIARGELRTPVAVNSHDELGVLADAFNEMRENLLSLVQRIQRSAVQLSSSINEIQAAATEQAASASQQASAVNQLSSSLNEMSQSASTLLHSSENTSGSVDGIAGVVTGNNQKSSQIMSSMDAIGNSTAQTAERIKSLNDKMDDINTAVSTISMVADQTTLLSLNASIEANKAGEMGKGFSVVAHEIRRLSDRSIDSAGNINAMVRDIQRATESSALAMDKSSEEIRHGIALVGESIDSLGAIDEAMERIQEQTRMIVDSVRAQAESSRMVQTTATEMLSSANMVSKAASQTRAVTYELNEMATALSEAVSVFKV